MWDDALIFRGRQTKWKYALILVVLALLALGLAWTLEHGQSISLHGWKLDLNGVWRESGCDPQTRALALEDRLCLLDDNEITVLDRNLQTVYTLEGEENMILSGEDRVIAYAPSGRQIYLLEKQGWSSLRISGGVDAVASGNAGLAVLTSGSGYLTRTVIFDETGGYTGRVDLKESAMVRFAFLGNHLMALCYGTDGQWQLAQYSLRGELLVSVTLETEICYDLISVGTGVAVLTSDALLFFDESGNPQNSFLIGNGQIAHWATGEKGYLAIVLCSRGQYRLITFSESGEMLGEAELPMEIRDLEVSGSNLCVLDFQQLRIYDPFCRLRQSSREGARAESITAGEKILWLLGDGEMISYKS